MLTGISTFGVIPVMVTVLDIYAVLVSASLIVSKENESGSASTVAM